MTDIRRNVLVCRRCGDRLTLPEFMSDRTCTPCQDRATVIAVSIALVIAIAVAVFTIIFLR